MARSRRNDAQRQRVTELESALHDDRAEIVGYNETPSDRLGAAQETLDLGHAGLRSECWGALRHTTPRLPRPARKRTQLHLARPSEAAEARFTSEPYEFIE